MSLCRKCGVELDNEVTRALGICTSCLVKYEGQPSVLPRPRYGRATATDKAPVPEIR